MRIMRFLSSAIAATALAGCGLAGPVISWTADQNASLVSAEPLSVTDAQMQKIADEDKKEFLGRVANDSIKKCNAFMSRLAVTENTVTTSGDIGATILSGLATIFTPINTVHALSGSATIVTGSKNAINSDIYNQASIANFQAALAATYYKAINDYTAALPKVKDADIVVSAEVSKLETIHATCGLAPAELAINSTMRAANTGNLCQLTSGPSSGTTFTMPGQLPVGTPCKDTAGTSSGVIVAPAATATTTHGVQPGAPAGSY